MSLSYDPQHPPMMGCGHAANSERVAPDGTRSPACVICAGIDAGASTIVEGPNLEGRMAWCPHCKREVPSRLGLPFFAHRPDADSDRYYCGCRGWD